MSLWSGIGSAASSLVGGSSSSGEESGSSYSVSGRTADSGSVGGGISNMFSSGGVHIGSDNNTGIMIAVVAGIALVAVLLVRGK